MIHKVSVVKKIMFLLMTMALAVAMVACSGAAGTPGPAGPPGQDAPTSDPTTPTTPTPPTEPAGPTGAAPVAKAIPPVYLALEGTGQALSKAIGLDTYITDADSQIKYSAMSSTPTVATATLSKDGRSVTIKAVRVGTATITVTARDGDNPAVEATISVTVVRTNAQPTTNDLSQLHRAELEKVLYVSDGARTDTVTVVASAGGTSSEPVEDSIADFKVAYGAKKALTSKYVAVSAGKGTAANQYVITVTPKKASLGKGSEKIMIYPKDMFGAESSEAWEFNAVFNRLPEALTDSISTIRLTRQSSIITSAEGVATRVGLVVGSVFSIDIDDYFNSASLQRAVKKDAPNVADDTGGRVVTAQSPSTVADELAKIDEVGDTVCEVTYSTSLAVVQLLNEAGAIAARTDGEAPVEGEIVATNLLRMSSQALVAIRIDSRFSSLGSPNLADATLTDPPTAADAPKVDKKATGEGAFDITIRCTDKDFTAIVTGRVVVKDE